MSSPVLGAMPRNGKEKGIATTISEGSGGRLSRSNSLGSAGKEAPASQAVLGRKISTQVVRQRHGTFRYEK